MGSDITVGGRVIILMEVKTDEIIMSRTKNGKYIKKAI